jgi:hypothetical protein
MAKDGVTMPIVAAKNDKGTYVVVDGFHRTQAIKEHTPIKKSLHGYVPIVELISAIIKYPAVMALTSISAPVLLSLFVINAITAITITAIAATSCILILVISASFVPTAANNVNAIYANTMITARNTRLLALLYC